MKNRASRYPGRVKLVPVPGQADVYDLIRADEPTEEGDPISKETLLKDATAALFGLGPDAVPDDAFNKLTIASRLNLHTWSRRTVADGYSEKRTNPAYIKNIWTSSQVSVKTTASRTIKYSENIVIAADGTVSLSNPISLALSGTNFTTANATLKGKYVNGTYSGGEEVIYRIPLNVSMVNDSSSHWYYRQDAIDSVTAESCFVYGEWEVLTSEDENAYPKSGIYAGHDYLYGGVPYENACRPIKIVTGSYVGTGTYGSSNPNSLSFESAPQFLMVVGYKKDTKNYTNPFIADSASDNFNMQYIPDMPTTYTAGAGFGCYYNKNVYGKKSKDGKTVSWYQDESSAYQYNTLGYTYYFIAILAID